MKKMDMSFWWDTVVKDFMFQGLNINTVAALIGTCVLLGGMAILFEYLKLLQAKQRRKELIFKSKQLKLVCPNTETSTLLRRIPLEPSEVTRKDRVILYCTDAILWLTSFNLSYVIMLAVMVYNVWITMAIIIGGGIGYFIFGQKFMKINMQNCQTLKDTYCLINCGDQDNNGEGESTPTAMPSSSCSVHQDETVTEATVHVHC